MTRVPPDDVNNRQGLLNLGSIPSKAPVAAFNLSQVTNLIETKGMEGWHIRHSLLPDKQTDTGPIMPSSQTGSQRGLWYYGMRKIILVPYSFKFEERMQVQGMFGMGSAVFNISDKYDDDLPERTVYVSPRDIIMLNPTITTPVREIFEYNPNGPQQLKYYIKGTDIVFDSDTRDYPYKEGIDFEIVGGMLNWTQNGRRPKFLNGQGQIVSIVYYASMVFVVENTPHHLRLLPSNEQGSAAFPRNIEYFPQLVVVKESQNVQETGLGFFDISNLPEYQKSKNTTGGSI